MRVPSIRIKIIINAMRSENWFWRLTDILQVQEQVVHHLTDKGVLQPLIKEEFQYIL